MRKIFPRGGILFLARRFFVVGFPFWIHGEPSALHPLVLVEHFAYAPEGREGRNSQQYACNLVFADEAERTEHEAAQKERQPDATAEVVFSFYHEGMKNPNDKESSEPDEYAVKIHDDLIF